MKKLSAEFDLRNGSKNDLYLHMEPEGGCFLLPPGKVVGVKIYNGSSMEMKHNITDGKLSVSMWLNDDGIEVFYEGRDVWDWIIEGGQ